MNIANNPRASLDKNKTMVYSDHRFNASMPQCLNAY